MSLRAIVKSVLSADTLVLRGPPANGQPPKERTLHLAGLDAPRVGSRDRHDEPNAFACRDFTRLLTVGKEVAFSIAYTIPSGGEFGLVHLVPGNSGASPLDVGLEVVRQGWSKVREQTSSNEDADNQAERRKELKEVEEEAKREKRGIWAEAGSPQPEVNTSMPTDPAAFLTEHKGKPIPAIIESVSNGSTLRTRLILSPASHQFVTLTMAGVRAPKARAYGSSGASSADEGEECGDEARFFTESRLLQRNVTVRLLSLPTPQGGNFASGSQATVGSLIGLVLHPAGSIAALLLANGLAKVVDWHAGILSSVPVEDGGGMERLRAAEKEGKSKRRGIWKGLAVPASTAGGAPTANGKHEAGKKYEATVTRVWSGDSVSVSADGTEKRVFLSSVRLPRQSETKLAGLVGEARESLRKRIVGKTVSVTLDYIKPADQGFEERECVTVRTHTGANVAENLIDRGYASVIRHRQGEDRSSDYDNLMAAEARAQSESRGLHSGKEFAAPKITDISENASRANSYLAQFKRSGRIPAVVDFVASGSRFKIWLPKQGVKMTLVLSGIRCPRTARNSGEKAEPYGQEAYELVNAKAMQRDVEIEADTTDKSGGFIGALYLNKTENLAVLLVQQGLASFNEHSGDRSPFAKELRSAQEQAQKERKNMWTDFDGEAHSAAANGVNGQAPAASKDYQDIIVSDVRTEPFAFTVQVLKDGGIPELSKLMEDFAIYHQSSAASSGVYRSGDLVSARFSADDAWYRAKVRKSNPAKKEAEVVFIDYGNSETLPYSRLRPLDPRFRSLPPQAKEATLSLVKLLEPPNEYAPEAIDRFRALAEAKSLVANVDYRDGATLHLSLYDPSSSSPDATSSINTQLVREGYARIDAKARHRSAYPSHVKALEKAREEARRSRAGAYEFGDALDDDDA